MEEEKGLELCQIEHKEIDLKQLKKLMLTNNIYS